jgi:4-oxalomesaconate tautomerase
MNNSIPCYIYRGGTSKGLFFLADDLPADPQQRDRVVMAAMGSPDARQIDGLGGAHPLTSKVAIVRKSTRDNIDVDYLFLQVSVDKAEVSSSQNCGNLLAAVGPFAIETGLIDAQSDSTDVRIYMENTGATAIASIETPNFSVNYEGDVHIDGVPKGSAAIPLDFQDIQGGSCGQLLPCGKRITVEGVEVSCVDNGMPVVVLNAQDFALTGMESPSELEANEELKQKLETIRLVVGEKMNLGDVSDKTVPKMSLLSKAQNGGLVNTRTFIPHRVHEAIGVLGAVSVATACLIPGTVAHELVSSQLDNSTGGRFDIEHPTGAFTVDIEVEKTLDDQIAVQKAALIRTARLLMRGEVIVPQYALEKIT